MDLNINNFGFFSVLQIGHGRAQFIIFLICGLVLASDLSELLAVIMSSKSAQFEFCVDDTQKSWLGKPLIQLIIIMGRC